MSGEISQRPEAAVIVVFASLAILLWSYLRTTPRSRQRNRAVPWGAWETAVLLVGFGLVVPVSIGILWRLVTPGLAGNPLFPLMVVALGDLLTVVLAPLLLVAAGRAQLYQMGLHCSRLGYNLALGLGTYFVTIPLVGLIWSAATQVFEPKPHAIEQVIREFPTWQNIGLAALTAVILAPLQEELLFRGILQPWLRRVLGVWPAIVLSSLLFAALHYDAWPAPIPLFVLALFLGYLAHRTSSLVAPVTLHAVFNGASMLYLVYSLA